MTMADLLPALAALPTPAAGEEDTLFLRGDMTWAAPSGGGGGGSGIDDASLWTPDLGYDYEFGAEGSDLPTGWSWVNQGTATYAEAYGAGLVTAAAASGGDNVKGIAQAFPTEESWTLTAKLGAEFASGNWASAGLLIRDSVGGKVVTFGLAQDDTVNVAKLTNVTSFSAFQAGASGRRDDLFRPYWRIVKNSDTSYDFLVSQDGISWWTHLAAWDLSGWIASPDQIGFFANSNNSVAVSTACHWFRIR